MFGEGVEEEVAGGIAGPVQRLGRGERPDLLPKRASQLGEGLCGDTDIVHGAGSHSGIAWQALVVQAELALGRGPGGVILRVNMTRRGTAANVHRACGGIPARVD